MHNPSRRIVDAGTLLPCFKKLTSRWFLMVPPSLNPLLSPLFSCHSVSRYLGRVWQLLDSDSMGCLRGGSSLADRVSFHPPVRKNKGGFWGFPPLTSPRPLYMHVSRIILLGSWHFMICWGWALGARLINFSLASTRSSKYYPLPALGEGQDRDFALNVPHRKHTISHRSLLHLLGRDYTS